DILAIEHDMLTPGSLDSDIEAELASGRSAAATASPAPAAPLRARVPPPVGSPPPPPRKKVTH
ncbi:MAG TPA: dihydrolipoamide succinyltransferase, partial [Vicinamibacteria bacterium]|nr:dihydrolipoamide succinyltransferase [Vicinamibacteria bacterium]